MNKRCIDCFYVKFCPNDPAETPCIKFLDETHVFVSPVAIGDTVYYIAGIHGKLIKSAKVEEISFNGSAITLGLVSENNVYFDMLLDKVYLNKTDAEKHIKNENNKLI